jgi:type II secretory pathway component GspD/PulD (secretin)
VFQAKIRGWRRLAAGLVLVPGLTGVGADALGLVGRAAGQERPAANNRADEARDLMRQAREAYDAQNFGLARELAEKARALRAPAASYDDPSDDGAAEPARKPAARTSAPPAAAATSRQQQPADPKVLTALAKQALEAGDLERAHELAAQAQPMAASVKWGFWDDTPATILRDVVKARARRDRETAVKLMAEARQLIERQTASRTERVANLTAAEEKAGQAARLNASYSMWDFGDRPGDILADARKVREKEKLGTSRTDEEAPKAGGYGAGRKPAALTTKDDDAAPSATTKQADATRKKAAVALMQEAKSLEVGRHFVEAKKKYTEAAHLNASFGKDEDTPETELARLNVAAQRRINSCLDDARSCLERKDPATARVHLDDAHALAMGMGLDASAVVELKATLKPAAPTAVVRSGGQPTTDDGPGPMIKSGTPKVEEGPAPVPVIRTGRKPMPEASQDVKPAAGQDGPAITPIPTVKSGSSTEIVAPIPPSKTKIKMLDEEPPPLPPVPDTKTEAEIAKPPMADTKGPAEAVTPPMPQIKSGIGAATPPMPETKSGIGAAPPMPEIRSGIGAAPPMPEIKSGIGAHGPMPEIRTGNEAVKSPMADKVDGPMPVIRSGSRPDAEKGQELLRAARAELKKGDTEAARKIAVEVINGPYGCKDEAMALLSSVDTKEAERKIVDATRAFEKGLDSWVSGNRTQAVAIFKQIDGALLTADKRKQMTDMMAAAQGDPKKVAGADDLPKAPKPAAGLPDLPPTGPAAPPRTGSDNLVKQQEALHQVEFQRLRTKGLRIESEATARFGRGETDEALMEMQNFCAEVKASKLEPAKQNLICRPIEARMDRLRILKHQTDFLTKEAKERRSFQNEMTQEALYKQKKQEEVAQLMKSANRLMDEAKYKEAYAKLQMAQSIEPDDASINTTLQMTERMLRLQKIRSADKSQEKFNFERMNEVHEYPEVTDNNPLLFSKDPEAVDRLKGRRPGTGSINVMRAQSEAGKVIERKMSTPLSVNFKATPLDAVVDQLRVMTAINFDLDLRGLKEGNVDSKMPITAELKDVSLKSALDIVCRQAGLRHAIESEAIRISTAKALAGRQKVISIPVGDLVIPAPNYGARPGMSLSDELRMATESGFGRMASGGSTPRTGPGGLPNGNGTGMPSTGLPDSNNRIRTNRPEDGGAGSNTGPENGGTLEKELIRLITNTIKPDSWSNMGGEGTIEYFPIGLALVINQSPEVIEEVERLLESLRKLQDLEVSIEVKVVSLAETFFERIGVDFSMGIPTNAKPIGGPLTGTTVFSTSNRNFTGNVIGLQTPGVPTPDLDIPIRATSFNRAIPPFGGFNNTFADGGIALGLAFLSDIQVQMFLEAAQGDTRTNVMQAPKLTALNGTAASMTVGDFQFFLTGITVTNVAGQLVFTPQNVPYAVGITQPIPPNASIQNGLLNFTPTAPQTPGLGLFIQPVVSADRRFVRLNIQQSFTNLISGTQQIPITTIITPVFENGGQGQPVPFTQFLQQPRFSNLETQTVVVVPDGGTVVMGGLKYMTEGRNEFGPPVLGKIPYLNRLFRNVAYGREGRSILIMVTPRVIINREEQERQTGVREDDFVGVAP